MNPNDRQNPNPYAGNNARNFMPFQGQGYALGWYSTVYFYHYKDNENKINFVIKISWFFL